MATDPYAVLGVSPDADAAEIDAAWRRACHEAHPDRNPDDPSASERLRRVLEAGKILRDPKRRARFDGARARAKEREQRRGAAPRPTWTGLAWNGGRAEPEPGESFRVCGGRIEIIHRK